MDSKQEEKIFNEPKETSAKTKDVRAFLKQALLGTVWAIFGYLLGGAVLPFGARPFGIALLCGSDRRVFYILAGLCLSAWFSPYRLLLLGIYASIVVLRLVVRFVLDPPFEASDGKRMGEVSIREAYPLLFSEHLSLRMATACLSAFAFGIYRLMEGGFLYYDLYGTILSSIVSPVFVLLVWGLFSGSETVNQTRKSLGVLALAAALIFSLGNARLYGVSLAVLACMFLTLYLTRTRGIVHGVIAGTLCGLTVSVSMAPLFAFGALAAGVIFPISSALALCAAFASSLAWGIYVQGIGILSGTLSALISSVVLFFAYDKLFLNERLSMREEIAADRATEEAPVWVAEEESVSLSSEIRWSDTQRRLKCLCTSFSSLSETFFEIAKRMQMPSAADLRGICDRAFEDSCASCAEKNNCWGEQYRTTSAEVGALSSALHKKGRVERQDAGEGLRARCARLPDVLEEINHNVSAYQRQMLQSDRTEIFALDYGALSELLSTAMVAQEAEFLYDAELSRMLSETLCREIFQGLSVGVYGKRRRKIFVRSADGEGLYRERDHIFACLQGGCPFPIELGAVEASFDRILEFWECERLFVTCAQRTLLADGEEKYCGDTVGVFRERDGRFFALISDGMGSGAEAAVTSGISGAYLRKMIGAGASCELAVRMLNGFLRHRGNGGLHECSATVDLLELDLMEGKASFYKNGAAPTYVFRNGGIFKLRSRTVPVGIIRETDTRRIGFDVAAGDMIVMVSDGITQGREECPWLFDLLRSQGEGVSADRIADLVVKYAKREGASDDLSVLVVKLRDNDAR